MKKLFALLGYYKSPKIINLDEEIKNDKNRMTDLDLCFLHTMTVNREAELKEKIQETEIKALLLFHKKESNIMERIVLVKLKDELKALVKAKTSLEQVLKL